MKVQKIEIKNYMLLDKATLDLKGCTCYVLGANNTGKSSVGSSVMRLLTNNFPDKPLKEGAEKGFVRATLENNQVIEYCFDEDKKKLTVIAPEGHKEKTPYREKGCHLMWMLS